MSTKIREELWFDRDLGWLEFNRHVLAEAKDARTPLLERQRRHGIVTVGFRRRDMRADLYTRENCQ